MEVLITKNKQELERLEGVIQENIGAFYEVGRALMKIRDQGYYHDVLGFETFKEYCRTRWDMARQTAYQLIDSASVIENVRNCGQTETIPTNEYQARPLARLDPDQQREAWKKAVETAPDGKVTAAHVYKVVKGMTGKEKTGTDKAKQKSARYFSNIAINALKKIDIGDPAREDEFSRVTLWIVKNRRREK